MGADAELDCVFIANKHIKKFMQCNIFLNINKLLRNKHLQRVQGQAWAYTKNPQPVGVEGFTCQGFFTP